MPAGSACDQRAALICEPCAVPGRLIDIFFLELWVLERDVVGRVTVAHQLQYEVHRDAQAANRRPTLAHGGVDADPIEHEAKVARPRSEAPALSSRGRGRARR